MKTDVHRPPARAAAVPHFVALLGVLREAAARGLSLLADAPAPRRLPGVAGPGRGRGGTRSRPFFQALEKTALPVSKPWNTAAAGGRG